MEASASSEEVGQSAECNAADAVVCHSRTVLGPPSGRVPMMKYLAADWLLGCCLRPESLSKGFSRVASTFFVHEEADIRVGPAGERTETARRQGGMGGWVGAGSGQGGGVGGGRGGAGDALRRDADRNSWLARPSTPPLLRKWSMNAAGAAACGNQGPRGGRGGVGGRGVSVGAAGASLRARRVAATCTNRGA